MIEMNRLEAENYVYASYINAEKYWKYEDPDRLKRNPIFTKKILERGSGTPTVIITGSKGKGSVSAMLSTIVGSSVKVGMLTSPHIEKFNERITICNEPISDESLCEYIQKSKNELAPIEKNLEKGEYISPIGIQAITAQSYFNDNHTQFNIFECGKGAQYDDVTNIIHDYSIINSIFLEHTRELGPRIEDIANDKKHVISGNEKCVYSAEQESGVINVIRQYAKDKGVMLKEYGKNFYSDNIRYNNGGMTFDIHVEDISITDVTLPLLGDYQARNCALAMALALDFLESIDLEQVKQNLSGIDWPGRFETICSNPRVILDACINSASCVDIIKTMKEASINRPNIIIGIPEDKDYLGVADAMKDHANRILLTKTDNPHYRFSSKQKEVLQSHGIDCKWYENLHDALASAYEDGTDIMILGTTSLVSDVKKLQKHPHLNGPN